MSGNRINLKYFNLILNFPIFQRQWNGIVSVKDALPWSKVKTPFIVVKNDLPLWMQLQVTTKIRVMAKKMGGPLYPPLNLSSWIGHGSFQGILLMGGWVTRLVNVQTPDLGTKLVCVDFLNFTWSYYFSLVLLHQTWTANFN